MRFRRQVPIGPWIADFACLNPRIVIEIDGASHDYRDERTRTAFLESQGFVVLRLNNNDVALDDGRLSEWVRDQIAAAR